MKYSVQVSGVSMMFVTLVPRQQQTVGLSAFANIAMVWEGIFSLSAHLQDEDLPRLDVADER